MQQLQMSMTMQPVLNRTGTAGSTTRAAVSNSMLYAIITQHAPVYCMPGVLPTGHHAP